MDTTKKRSACEAKGSAMDDLDIMQVKLRTNSSFLQINNQTSLLPTDIHNERILKTSALPKTNTLRKSIPSDAFPSSPVGERVDGVYMSEKYIHILRNLPCFERDSET
jgi:hypothetical protein